MKFEVGQKVLFTQPLFYTNNGLVEGEVSKVENKYVYIKRGREFKFNIETLRESNETNYAGRIYPSKEDYLNEQELNNNMQLIQKTIRSYGLKLSLHQTREILKILNSTDN